MKKKLTITLEEDVYEGLQQVVGRGKIGLFLEELARPHVSDTALEAAYAEDAADEESEREAEEWCEGTISDVGDEPW